MFFLKTVGEHLLFYARLRGISHQDEEESVEEALRRVSLVKERNVLAKVRLLLHIYAYF